MNILNIYLVCCLLCFVIFYIYVFSIEKRIKREHIELYIKLKNTKRSLTENIFSIIKTFFACIIPIINIAFIMLIIFGDNKMYEKIIEQLKNKSST